MIEERLPSLNEYIRMVGFGVGAVAAFKRRWEKKIAKYFGGIEKVESPCVVEMRFTEEDKPQKRDLDNVESARKFILDSLVAAGMLPNDTPRWVVAIPSSTDYGEKAKVTVTIREIKES